MVDIRNLKIGLAPAQKFPATIREKRGFLYYAKQKKIAFEIADPNKKYDLIFVSCGADLSVWSDYQKDSTKIVYELIDSYFAIPAYSFKNLLRGVAKYVTGQHKYLLFNQRKTYESMCKQADAIICCTIEQQKYIETLCPNTHIIMDSKHMFKRVKRSYAIHEEINIVWEGLPYNIKSFSVIKNALSVLNKRYKVNLHLITSIEYGKYMGEYIKKQTINDVRKMFDVNAIYLYGWNIHTYSEIAGACDLAATPTHMRAMAKAELSMTCSSEEQWIELLEYYIKNLNDRELAANKGFAFASSVCNEKVIVSQYDDVMNSVIN